MTPSGLYRNSNPWVNFTMWVGNVPSDASEAELYTFVSHALLHPYTLSNAPYDIYAKLPTSIHLISYTNCAFLNFSTQAILYEAIAKCSGRILRPWFPSSLPPLVCRERTEMEELVSGVNGQRVGGMHKEWVANQKQSERVAPRMATRESDEGYASESSELLAEHFPVRYFILKSSTMEPLTMCLQTGVWRTQPHNEKILDKAFRTSSEVILIFSVNNSKEFGCFGRMASRIYLPTHEENGYSSQLATPQARFDIVPRDRKSAFSEDDLAFTSLPSSSKSRGEKRPLRRTLSESVLPTTFKPTQTIPSSIDFGAHSASWVTKENENLPSSLEPSFPCIYPSPTITTGLQPHEFRVEWINVHPIPFYRLHRLNNPWNQFRPVQVARDGIEIEPSAGKKLISRWRTWSQRSGISF